MKAAMRERGVELLYRGRLLAYAGMAALGGAAGSAGRSSAWWPLLTAAAAVAFLPLLRGKGWRAGWSALCVVFFCAGLYSGHAHFARWQGRAGQAGEVSLVGEVGVGSRGERDDSVDIVVVKEVLSGSVARAGDRYLLRNRDRSGARTCWGDTLALRGELFLFARESGGVGGSLVAREVRVLAHSGEPLLRVAMRLRSEFEEQAAAIADPAAYGLVAGMVLGDYRKLGARDLMAFRLTGLVHLCAASGLHLAIVGGFIFWLARRVGLSRRAALAVHAPVILAYALAVGLSVPVMRAAAVALVAAAAYFLGRDFDLLPALGVAALYLLWRDPAAASGVSFQLCFAAALGLALLYRPLCSLMRAGESRLKGMMAATLAAQLAVAPILLCHFGEVSILAPLGNLLVLPLVPAVMALSMLSTLVGAAGLPLAGIPMQAAGVLARCILAAARALAAPQWGSLHIYPLSPLWLLLYYPALCAAFLAGSKWKWMGRAALAVLISAALVCGMAPSLGAWRGGAGMRVTFFDVGQGDSTLLQAPSGATVLVDGGPDERALAGELRSRGIRYIDALVLSHPEADHMGGLEAALENCSVGMLVHPDNGPEARMRELLALAEETGVEVRAMRAGDTLALGEMVLTAWGPAGEAGGERSENDRSLVLKAEGPGLSMLFTGDVEEEGEQALMDRQRLLSCDILKVPHHGGHCAKNEELFARVHPAIALIGVGEDNPYGHPAKSTLEALRRAGCAVYRTDTCGDIVIRVVEGGYAVECEKR